MERDTPNAGRASAAERSLTVKVRITGARALQFVSARGRSRTLKSAGASERPMNPGLLGRIPALLQQILPRLTPGHPW